MFESCIAGAGTRSDGQLPGRWGDPGLLSELDGHAPAAPRTCPARVRPGHDPPSGRWAAPAADRLLSKHLDRRTRVSSGWLVCVWPVCPDKQWLWGVARSPEPQGPSRFAAPLSTDPAAGVRGERCSRNSYARLPGGGHQDPASRSHQVHQASPSVLGGVPRPREDPIRPLSSKRRRKPDLSSGPGLNRHFVTFCIYGISDFSVGAALYYNCIYVYAHSVILHLLVLYIFLLSVIFIFLFIFIYDVVYLWYISLWSKLNFVERKSWVVSVWHDHKQH